jgi:hypothetical protein
VSGGLRLARALMILGTALLYGQQKRLLPGRGEAADLRFCGSG